MNLPTQGSVLGLLHWRWILNHQIHQGSRRILEWFPIAFSRGASRDWTWVSCTAGEFFTIWATNLNLSGGFPGDSNCRVCLQCRRPRFNPWVGKIPLGRKSIPWECTRLPTGAASVDECQLFLFGGYSFFRLVNPRHGWAQIINKPMFSPTKEKETRYLRFGNQTGLSLGIRSSLGSFLGVFPLERYTHTHTHTHTYTHTQYICFLDVIFAFVTVAGLLFRDHKLRCTKCCSLYFI